MDMKIINLAKINLISILFLMPAYSYAQTQLSIGQLLTKKEHAQLKSSKIKLNQEIYDIIPSNIPDQIYLINDQGAVGIGETVVIITEVSQNKFKTQASHILSLSDSIEYYDHMKIVHIKFKNFSQTLNAYNQLLKIFPEDNVSIPIQFSQPKPR